MGLGGGGGEGGVRNCYFISVKQIFIKGYFECCWVVVASYNSSIVPDFRQQVKRASFKKLKFCWWHTIIGSIS